jgi:hypothetical protein
MVAVMLTAAYVVRRADDGEQVKVLLLVGTVFNQPPVASQNAQPIVVGSVRPSGSAGPRETG